MGCLNSTGNFKHWFGNIHLSGPCNARCYFCIGQHMMQLDSYNTLGTYPLPGWDEFAKGCVENNVEEIYLTGTNTDPLLYRHISKLKDDVHALGCKFGARTNGLAIGSHPNRYNSFDKVSVSIPTLNKKVYKQIMGVSRNPPTRSEIFSGPTDVKINVVLCKESAGLTMRDLETFAEWGITRVNLREPYGQPHVGNPLDGREPVSYIFGMPQYQLSSTVVTYWDVHYVEVESVNLYASGRVSLTYPITKGCADDGLVRDQSKFVGGRVHEQWVKSYI